MIVLGLNDFIELTNAQSFGINYIYIICILDINTNNVNIEIIK